MGFAPCFIHKMILYSCYRATEIYSSHSPVCATAWLATLRVLLIYTFEEYACGEGDGRAKPQLALDEVDCLLLNFVDSYKYNIAAYELAALLGLDDMVPVYVERKFEGKTGSFGWWLPVQMDEADRLKRKNTRARPRQLEQADVPGPRAGPAGL
jgi:hypothetical protein